MNYNIMKRIIAIGRNECGGAFTVTAEETPTVTSAQLAELRQKLMSESQRRTNLRNGMRAVAEAIHAKHRWLFAPAPKPSASHDDRQFIICECGKPLTPDAIDANKCGGCSKPILMYPVDFAEAVAEVLGADSELSPMDHDAIDNEHIGADFSERPYLY